MFDELRGMYSIETKYRGKKTFDVWTVIVGTRS